MATLTAWKFDDPDKAEEAEGVLEKLQKEGLIEVIDAAWVTWPPGGVAPKTHQTRHHTHDYHHPAAVETFGGAFFGFVLGLIFLVPVLGLAVGAAAGLAVSRLNDVGIDENFIEKVREKVTPGTSALFALTQDADQDKVRDAFSGFHPELISSNLTEEQEKSLREVFSIGH
jgi:uncharacterized membrane protein